ncbi:amidase domain-containing protein [Cryobacterium roopkundense]|uniref:Putative amidase domain-containing protein n=1 Tax=Cryobacterium roopkundense TaxID=1001240 RepID=A0A7W9A069_9MICO|nr:amidase domain-containing protein [Cryobacterium roopkundense]MBB5643392.1 hypothetical protein [Cryobacterium roopkundense]
MVFSRWQRVGAAAVVGAVVVVGATALVVQAVTDPSEPTAATTPVPTETDAAPRATPQVTTAPVPVPTAPPLDPAVQAQVDYALVHWQNYNAAEYGVLGENDCVNFASQTLIERGWAMDATWNNPLTGDAYAASAAWRSSTALMRYLADSGRATALTDQQRDQVKVGDIAQFDWDNSGDRDHTGVVTKVERVGDTISISFAGHTLDSDFRSVDTAITVDHPGGTAYYWSIP